MPVDSMHWISYIPRGFFLVIVVYAPWAFGCTRAWTIEVLNYLLFLCFTGWMIERGIKRRVPRLPWVPVCLCLLLLAQGWWMVWNAHSVFDVSFWTEISISGAHLNLPGSMDRDVSFENMLRVMGLIVAFVMVLDWAKDSVWRRHLLITIGISGALLAVFGLIQRAAEARSIFWGERYMGEFFFATFRYHANAGAFLNLIWPVLGALFLGVLNRKDQPVLKAVWVSGFLFSVMASFVHGSRAASGITFFLILIWIFWHRSTLKRKFAHLPKVIGIVVIVLGVFSVGAAFYGTEFDQTQKRWVKTTEKIEIAEYPRFLTYAVCLKEMIPDSGYFGKGPATFKWAFPFYTKEVRDKIRGFWKYTHQDYLQTVIEWGYVGAALWFLLLFGGAGKLFLLAGERREGKSAMKVKPEERYLKKAMSLAVLSVALHALIDFPMQIASIQLYVFIFIAIGWTIAYQKKTG